MKKLFVILLSLLMLLCSCASEEAHERQGISYPYESDLRVKYGGREYYLSLSLKDVSDATLSFSSPSSLNGLKLTVKNGRATLNYCGIEIPVDSEYAKKHGLTLVSRILVTDSDDYAGSKTVKRSGVTYIRERYVNDDATVDIYFADGQATPSFMEATVGEEKFEIIFVNNK